MADGRISLDTGGLWSDTDATMGTSYSAKDSIIAKATMNGIWKINFLFVQVSCNRRFPLKKGLCCTPHGCYFKVFRTPLGHRKGLFYYVPLVGVGF